MGKITVDAAADTLTIYGSGLASSTGTTVEIGSNDESLTRAEIVSKTDRAVVVKNAGWINNVETVKVTGYQGKSDVRRDVYLVDGKKSLAESWGGAISVTGSEMVTDGKKIYWFDNDTGTIQVVDPGNLEAGQATFATIEPRRIFETRKSVVTGYCMESASALTYCNGSLYAVLGNYATYEAAEGVSTRYSGDLRLVSVSLGDDAGGGGSAGTAGAVTSLGKLPVESGLVDVTAAATEHGKVTGTGSFMPGNTVTAKVTADAGYRIKSLQLNGKAVELQGNPTSHPLTMEDLVADQLIAAEFEPVPVEPAPVEPVDISGAKVSDVSDQVYDGKEKRPAVKVELAGKELTPGEDYSVEYRDNTNVGTATVVVTGVSTGAGAGGYTGTATGTFRIVKAQNPLSPKGKTVKVTYSKLKSKPQAVKRASAIDLGKAGAEGAVTYSKLWGDGLISVDKKTGNLTLAKGLKPYTYEVGVLICAAGNGNYSPAKEYVNVTVKVSKAENTLSATGKKATVSAAKLKKASVNVSRSSAIKVSNAKGALSYAKVSGNKKIAVDAKTGKLTVAKGLKKGSYKVKVKVTAKGNSYYKSAQKTVTATVRVK